MNPNQTQPKESATRKKIDDQLKHLGWNTDEEHPDCDVFTERPKSENEALALKGRTPDYVLYAPETDDAIAVIEAKKPGTTLNRAIEQGLSSYANPLGVNIVFATDGNLCQSYDIRGSGPLHLDGEPIVSLLTPKLLVRFANDGPDLRTPTPNQQTKQELIQIFATADDLLRREGLRQGIERFSEFTNLLFLKLISEIEENRESTGQSRRLKERYCWSAFAKKPKDEMLDYINDTVLQRLIKNYNHSSEVFEPRLRITNAATLQELVQRLSELSLLDTDSDIKGDAFEYFLKHSISVGNDLGEYFTPRHVVRLMVDLIDPRYGETVYDPCCGTGGFLIQAFRHIASKVTVTSEHRRVLENDTIHGCELTGTARIAKMNMILAGDGHTNIFQRDSLANPLDSLYDVVLTNFPFSQETEHGKSYNAATKDANPVFLRHVVKAAKDGGRIGVVVPEGLLFGEQNEYVKARQYVVDNCAVEAIISLHSFVFRPYTGQPTAILILTKGGIRKPIWFFEVTNDGFEDTTRRTGRPPTSDGLNDLLTLRSLWAEKLKTDKSFTVDLDRVRNNLYKLSYSSYRAQNSQKGWKPLGDVCHIKIGATPRRKEHAYWQNGNKRWATITDISNMETRYLNETAEKITKRAVKETSVKQLPRGTVLLTYKLSIGKTAIVGKKLYTNEAIAGLVPKDPEKLLSEYLYYLLPFLNIQDHAQPAAKGYTLNKSILERLRIPVPDTSEQRKFIERMRERESKAQSLREEAAAVDREQQDDALRFIAAQ